MVNGVGSQCKRSLTFNSKLNYFYLLIKYRVNGDITAFTHLEQFM